MILHEAFFKHLQPHYGTFCFVLHSVDHVMAHKSISLAHKGLK